MNGGSTEVAAKPKSVKGVKRELTLREARDLVELSEAESLS